MVSNQTRFEDLQTISATQLDKVIEEAAASPRKRSHLLLHAGPDDQVQRLLIAAQPGTYVRPHRHSGQWEMLALHRGRLDVLTFDSGGGVLTRLTLDQSAPIVQIPISVWHSCVVRDPYTVVLEIKPGPYHPNEFAAWAPEEGEVTTKSYLQWLTIPTADHGRQPR